MRLRWANQVVMSWDLCAERLSSTTWISSELHLGVDGLEEGEHLFGGVTSLGVVDDFTGGHVHRGEEIRRAVTPVVVRHG